MAGFDCCHCDATDAFLGWQREALRTHCVRAEWSVYMGNGWLGCAVMPLMFALSDCFWNRASPWGIAGSAVL